jgi:hypothetical protein
VLGCEIRSYHVSTTKIEESESGRSVFANCQIDDCKLCSSTLHECQTSARKKENCVESRAPLALRRFPPEIRAIIFAYSSHFRFSQGNWKQTSRPLKLAAILVVDQELYQELIGPNYTSKVYSSNAIGPSIRIGFMGNMGLQRIRKLTIR